MGNKHLGFGLKVAFAAASGFCCWLAVEAALPEPLVWGLPGLLFAAGVLFPYLWRRRFWWLRGLGLIVISATSYRCAIQVAAQFTDGGNVRLSGFMLASLVGAAIVLIGARLLISLSQSVRLMFAGFVAASVGAVGFWLFQGGIGFWLLEDERWYIAFMLWHSLMALAIYGSENWPLPFAKAK